jgi:hypothetical protein
MNTFLNLFKAIHILTSNFPKTQFNTDLPSSSSWSSTDRFQRADLLPTKVCTRLGCPSKVLVTSGLPTHTVLDELPLTTKSRYVQFSTAYSPLPSCLDNTASYQYKPTGKMNFCVCYTCKVDATIPLTKVSIIKLRILYFKSGDFIRDINDGSQFRN